MARRPSHLGQSAAPATADGMLAELVGNLVAALVEWWMTVRSSTRLRWRRVVGRRIRRWFGRRP